MVGIRPKVFKTKAKQRYGKGFSREELKKAGTSVKDALRFNIPVDSKRKTAHEENVKAVKAFLQEIKPVPKPVKAERKSKSRKAAKEKQ